MTLVIELNPGSVVHLEMFLRCDIYLVRIFISPKAIQLHIYMAYLEHYLTGARHGEGMVNMERMFLLLTIFFIFIIAKGRN